MNTIIQQQNPKRILISGYYGFGNTGDEAILDGMMYQIKEKVKDCSFIIVSENPEDTMKLHGIDSIHRLDYKKISEEIEKSDLVILGGGGLFQDHHKIDISAIFSNERLGITKYAEVPLLAKMHGKPVMFYSQGFGPFFSKESKTFVAFVSSLADIITTRDKASKGLLEDIGIDSKKIIVSFDPAFEIPTVDIDRIKEILVKENIPTNKKFICISIRGWIDKLLEEKYTQVIAHSLEVFLEKYNINLLFMPFQINEQCNNDFIISTRIIEKISQKEKCHILSKVYCPKEMAGIIGAADLVIGMRLHSIIFAARNNIPLVALSYDQKIDNLMKDLNLEDFCFNIFNADSNELTNMITKAWENLEKIKNRLRDSVSQIMQKNYSPIIAYSFLEGQPIQVLDEGLQVKVLEKIKNQRLKDTVYRQTELLAFAQKQYIQYCKDKEIEIQQLKEQINSQKKQNLDSQVENQKLKTELQKIYSSKGWKVISLLVKIIRIFKMEAPLSFIIIKLHRLYVQWKQKNSQSDLKKILSEASKSKHIKGIIIYPPTIDWGYLFQRPQQLALSFAKHGYLFFYCTGNYNVDNVHGFKKIRDNLYLCNVPMEVFSQVKNPILLITYLINKTYIRVLNSPFIIYDHIDELEIFYQYDQKMETDHQEMLKKANIVTSTAKRLYDKDKIIRDDVLFCPNGVDYEVFQKSRKRESLKIPVDLKTPLHLGKPIIGYYGALAPWMDYEMIKFAAENRKNYTFVFIGPDYDGQLKNRFKENNIDSCANVFWLGTKNFEEIPIYLAFFDVATIPFKINNITLSTSPIKLFEYMAGGKPVVTTDLPECRTIPCVFTAKTKEEYVEYLDKAISLKNDDEFIRSLYNYARANTWDARVESIMERIERIKSNNQNKQL